MVTVLDMIEAAGRKVRGLVESGVLLQGAPAVGRGGATPPAPPEGYGGRHAPRVGKLPATEEKLRVVVEQIMAERAAAQRRTG